jgi:hypothetical protein
MRTLLAIDKEDVGTTSKSFDSLYKMYRDYK